MAHRCALLEVQAAEGGTWLTRAADALLRRMPCHPPPVPLECGAVSGKPDAATTAARVLVRPSHVPARVSLHQLLELRGRRALHAALSPGYAGLGRHWLQVGGVWEGAKPVTQCRAWVGGA